MKKALSPKQLPLCLLIIFISCLSINAQSVEQNYTKTVQFLEPAGINSLDGVAKIESVTYFDGFGRVKQSVGVKQSPTKKDVITHVAYDEFDRKSKQYLSLPTSQNNGNYIENAKSQIETYYQNEFSDQHPYSQVIFDDSPLNRTIKSTSPGNAWQIVEASDNDHTVKYEYTSNESSSEVYRMIVNDDNQYKPVEQKGYYIANRLMKNVVKNSNWQPSDGKLNTTEVFTDKNGRKVAEYSYETYNGTIRKLRTHYVYDYLGNLRYVLPPRLFINSFDDFSADWPIADFLSSGASSSDQTSKVNFTINNNRLIFDTQLQSINNKLNNKVLKTQIVKQLNTQEPLPDMYIGEVRGIVEGSNGQVGQTILLGHASIANGDLVINRTRKEIFGRLAFYVSFKFDVLLSEQNIDNLAFQYKYDQYNRQIAQKVPGKDWEYTVYDNLDRPILTQDANLRTTDQWLFNKYDAFGRVVYSGLHTYSGSRERLQAIVDSHIASNTNNKSNAEKRTTSVGTVGGVAINYTNTAYPTTDIEVNSVSYFDDYNFTDANKPTIPAKILGQSVTNRTKGLLTGSWVKVLDGTNTWTKSYAFYDEKGSVIEASSINYLGGRTKTKSKLDFRGKVTATVTEHKRLNSNDDLVIKDYYTYDHVERPLGHTQSIGGNPTIVENEIHLNSSSSTNDETDTHIASQVITITPEFTAKNGFHAYIDNSSSERELIAYNTYNELGQLKSKKVGGKANVTNLASSPGLQTIDYKYNIRGWVTHINDVNNLGNDLFAYNLKYNEAIEGSASVPDVYNGNIKQAIWKTALHDTKKSYAFQYDKLNRFIGSQYRENNTLTGGTTKFNTSAITYDAHGNIEKLSRTSQTGALIDNLTYNYDKGNKLLAINDAASSTLGFVNGNLAGNDYNYDSNGNLTKDLNKNINNITYNYLDRVKNVTLTNGTIAFKYSANGTKLAMTTNHSGQTAVTEYLGGFQYQNGQLQFFPTPEGYVNVSNGNYQYVYIYRDQVGNNRLSYSDVNNDGIVNSNEIQSNTDYYVMGLAHAGELITNSNYNYKYQGKEKLTAYGYNMYDFGSRMYDPTVGRWFNTDPQNQFYSPYLAMGNNHVSLIDPNGEVVPLIVIGAAGLIGGTLNIAANWDRIDNPWEAVGHFVTGAGTGIAGVTLGPGAAALVSMAAGTADELIQGNTNPEVLIRAGVQSGIGSAVGGAVGKHLGKGGDFLFNKLKITNVLAKNTIGGALGGGITSGLLGGVFNAAEGRSFSEGFWSGAKTGFFYGGVTSAGLNIANSYSKGMNPFTDKPLGLNKDGTFKKWPTAKDGFKEGFARKPKSKVLKSGDIIERRGGTSGSFATDPNTPLEQLSMSPGSEKLTPKKYMVREGATIEVKYGKAAPWFGQPGGGTQYKFPQSLDFYLNGDNPLLIPID